MIKYFTFLAIFLAMTVVSINGQTFLEIELFEMKDVIFNKIESPDGYKAAYEIMIKQPLDHKNPENGSFYQRLYLSHRDIDAPLVLVTEGYNRDANRVYELSEYMQANQLIVEHRYFGKSVPSKMDYNFLNLEQATADIHRVRNLFGEIYAGPKLSTGISKGGMTTLFYRYFYPEDVDVSVPYVAPINVDYKDKRIYHFLNSVGSEECRKKIKNFQIDVLKNKEKYMPYIRGYADAKDLTFDHLGYEKALEYVVLEYSFSIWQMGHSCDDIPISTTDFYDKAKHLMEVIGIDFYSDKDIDELAPFYYQMGTEMGYYGYETSDFSQYMSALGDEPTAVFAPEGVSTTFDATLTKKANKYFENKLERVIYINGATDTWSATAVDPDDNLDAKVFTLKGKNHRNARIKSMSKAELKDLETTLERWLQIDVPDSMPVQPKN